MERTYTLVFGGGGLKGLAHVGVLQALEEVDWLPHEVVGSSVGALVAATWCSGMSVAEMQDVAIALERKDLFRIAHSDMALKRMLSPALYRREPLADFVNGLLGDMTFNELEHPLLVNTVDINSGTQVFWGAPGLRDLRVADAVIASCSLPGFLPPHDIRGNYYVDGAAAANLPVQVADIAQRDLVLAIDVSGRGSSRNAIQRLGFASVYARAIEIGIQVMQEAALRHWTTPPLVLLRPKVWHVPLLSFSHNAELIAEGYRVTRAWLDDPEGMPEKGAGGVWPRHSHRVRVDQEICVGCGTCVVAGPPGLFRMDDNGKATVTNSEPLWSPMDGRCVSQCPVGAISAERVD